MPVKNILSAKGLFTDPNLLSGVPEGALVQADNIIIDRDDVIQPRRGFSKYGNNFGTGGDLASQLMTYKGRLLVHFNDKILYNAIDHNSTSDGLFLQFDGSYSETEAGLRIKYIESNKNLYFTTSDGIKKIAASSASDFTTASGYIIDAGAYKALDVIGFLNFESEGFLPANSKVAYRVVWGYTDINDNLLLGSPSSRVVVSNYSDETSNVDLTFSIPTGLTDNYFYQIYRTAIFTTVGNLTLDDINPGDEMNLVYEGYPTSAELLAGEITVTDIASDDFRQNGLPLYTNPNSGDGIDQSNEPPPKAKDVARYQNSIFYANTETKANTTISLLSTVNFVSGSSQFIINSSLGTETYTFVGDKENTTIDFTAYSGTIPADLDGKYWLLNSASNYRKYYVWYDNTKTTQKLDFSNYVGTIPADLDGRYVILYTDGDRSYYVWFDSTGSTSDPGLDPNNTILAGMIGIKVDVSAAATKADIATAVDAALVANNVFNDYDSVYTPANEYVEVETASFDETGITAIENIQKGFIYTIDTPVNNDPKNTPLVHTDVVGRIPFKVNVSRNISTVADLADATAAAILDQDSALDFNVSYTTSNSFLTIENTNNGNTNDAIDSLIDGLGNSFSITVTNQGDGEDKNLLHVLLSDAPTPSQQIDESARSLVNIINSNASSAVYAFYISGANDLPGQILLQSRDISTSSFTITANDATTGEQFNPALPPAPDADVVEGLSETKPNRIYYSKIQQPEAVPLLNFVDVGSEDKEISRILALRESLFILKEDGVFRLTGFDGNFIVDSFDVNIKIIAPDSAVTLNNKIHCLTNQGVAEISDTGIQIISKQIDNYIQNISSFIIKNKNVPFGISYETDRCYLLFIPSTENDTVATQCFRYNTATQTWTRWTLSKTCGLVLSTDDKIYLGPSDENFIEKERKNYNRTDHADRDIALELGPNAVSGTSVTLSQTGVAEDGDALVQSQYLTIKQYNQLLKKIDLDPFTGEKEKFTVDFTSYVGSIPANLHTKYFIMYSASNAQKYVVFYDATGSLSQLNPAVFTEAINATQIRVDISSGITTLAQLTDLTQNTIKSQTQEFVINYINGSTSFTGETVRNGETNDAKDSAQNPIGLGFSIVVTTQGSGDYFSSLVASAGDSMKDKLDALAIKLDNDPYVSANDFLASISLYSDSGVTVNVGNPAIINSVSHNLQTGRIVTISNSTTTPLLAGDYVITKIDDDNFSIDVNVTSGGTCDWVANVTRSIEHQGMFNTIVNKLNDDAGVLFTNYPLSLGTTEIETLIVFTKANSPIVDIEYNLDLVEGEITLYKGLRCEIVYAPELFGDPTFLKQVRDGTFMFENCTFTGGIVGYRSDLSSGISEIPFNKSGKGDWNSFVWSYQNWGGGFSAVPLRTLIPVNKQRCRYIQAYFQHLNSRESWALFGISYTYRPISERAYRG